MSKIQTAVEVYNAKGLSGVAKISGEKFRQVFLKPKKLEIKFLVKNEDVIECDWDTDPKTFQSPKKSAPYTFNWIMHPPGKGSGGHQNIFRFIKVLEDAGHTCRIYLYSNLDFVSVERVRENISSSYSKVNADISWLNGEMDEADAIFATGWETAYAAYNQKSNVKRFYFIQDYEPYFYTVGSEHALAENTYRFGFYGITAGKWLTSKLSQEFNMKCDFYDFGVDSVSYVNKNHNARNKVFFYARPVTSRRGFELGILALKKFHDMNPNTEIVMAGWDVSNYKIDFPFTSLDVCDVEDLPEIYNECAAALILSFSNLSLLPLELLSCGTIPVINKGENNEMVCDNSYLQYCEPTPGALAFALDKVVNSNDQAENALKASESVSIHTWDQAGEQFLAAVERELHG